MKSFQAVILAAILAAASADNEPVASPTFFKQELAKYEHQLRNLSFLLKDPPVQGNDQGTGGTSPPTPTAQRTSQPTPGSYSTSMSYGGKGGKSGGGKGGKSGSGGSGKGGKSGSKGGKSDSYSYSTSMSYGSGKGGKGGGGSGKGGKSGSKRE